MTCEQSLWGRELRACAAAFTFLTRLPLARLISHDLRDLGNSATYFPLVGLYVGVVGTLAFSIVLLFWTPLVAVVISVIIAVLVTGAFHEDALADSLDGFGGGWTKEQVLSIMKDSRVGSYALIGMVLMVLVKVSALSAIHDHAAAAAGVSNSPQFVARVLAVGRAFIAAHVLARWSSVWLIHSHEYVRVDDAAARASAGRPFVNAVTNTKFACATALALVLVVATLQLAPIAAFAIVVTIVVTVLAGRYFNRRIGGITGDALGAANQIVESAVYLVLAAHPTSIVLS